MKSFFISSTFRDMQEERDMIHRIVFPAVKRRLKKYGEIAEEVDMRWGVDTLNLSEEESGHMVIRVCIDAIDRCVPYFIVLLGERYGWIPENSLFSSLHDERLEKYNKDMSITELEIQYGTLERITGMEKCVFCFRDPSFISDIPEPYKSDYVSESKEHAEKLSRLKEEIRQKEGVKVLEYIPSWDTVHNKVSGLEMFAQQLEDTIIDMVMQGEELQTANTLEEQVERNAEMTRQQYMATYVNRPKLEEFLPLSYAIKKNQWFVGEAGSGKTAFLSFAATQARGKGMQALLYYGGNPRCESVEVFLCWLVQELEKICDKKCKGVGTDKKSSFRKIKALDGWLKEKVVLFVDALDQMEEEIVWTLVQILSMTSKIQLQVSSRKHIKEFDLTETEEQFICRKIEDLDWMGVRAMATSIARRRGKRLDVSVINQILEKGNLKKPIEIVLLLQRIFMMDGEEFAEAEKMKSGMEGISLYMSKLVAEIGDSLNELVASVVEKACQCMGMQIGDNKMLGLLCAAPSGLSLQMLRELCPDISALQMQQLFSYLYDMVEEVEDGCWRYKHQVYKNTIEEMVGESALNTYQQQVYEKLLLADDVKWQDLFILSRKTGRFDLDGKLSQALMERAVAEETFYNYVNLNQTYFIKLEKSTQQENIAQYLLKGIFLKEINLSKEIENWMESLNLAVFYQKITLFYYYGAKSVLVDADYGDNNYYRELQYQVYLDMEAPSEQLMLYVFEICADGCCMYELEKAKIWFGRLQNLEASFRKAYKDSVYNVLISECVVWYWKFQGYTEAETEEKLESLQTYAKQQYKISEVHENLNLYEQEHPEYVAACMRQAIRYCRNLASILMRKKDYAKTYVFGRVHYLQMRKQYQLHRTYAAASELSRAATRMVQCVKKERQEEYFTVAEEALNWQETLYYCRAIGEEKEYLYRIFAEDQKKADIMKKAIEEAEKLQDSFGKYESWVLGNYRSYLYCIGKTQEHKKFNELKTVLLKIEDLANNLLNRTKKPFYEKVLYENTYQLFTLYSMQENVKEAEHYLELAESYKKDWMGELNLVTTAACMYYRVKDFEKYQVYSGKALRLMADQAEIAKEDQRIHVVNIWKGYLLHMEARIIWETEGDKKKAKMLVEERLKMLEMYQNEDLLRPSYLLLGEIEQSIEYLEKVCDNGKKLLYPWDTELSEQQIVQYMMAGQAFMHLYELTKDKQYLFKGTSTLGQILGTHTYEMNPGNRRQLAELYKQYFLKYESILSAEDCRYMTNILKTWLDALEAAGNMDEIDLQIKAKALAYHAKCIKVWGCEEERNALWLKEHGEMEKYGEMILFKASWNCVNNQYEEAKNVLKQMVDEQCISNLDEKKMLEAICNQKTDAMQLVRCRQLVEKVKNELNKKGGYLCTKLWLYIELLIYAVQYDSENVEQNCRAGIKALEYIRKKVTDTSSVDEKIYFFRKKCVEISGQSNNTTLYIEDLKAMRLAYATCGGNDKQSIYKLLEMDAQIAKAYIGVDEKEEVTRWIMVANILRANVIKRGVATREELERFVAFYEWFKKKVSYEYLHAMASIDVRYEFPYELAMKLFDETGDASWLEYGLGEMLSYRQMLKAANVSGKQAVKKGELIAESYIYDMDLYQAYLKHEIKEEVIGQLVECGKAWVSDMPAGYEAVINIAETAFGEMDKLLNGKSLGVRKLEEVFAVMLEKDDTNKFWCVKELFDKYGSSKSADEMWLLYEKELNERQKK